MAAALALPLGSAVTVPPRQGLPVLMEQRR